MLKILSSGIRKIEFLNEFLKEELERYSDPERVEAVAGWGFKKTAAEARKLNVSYIALEDGFLRSLDLGVNGAQPLSISVDPVGCYYAADRPSLIEQTVAEICQHPESSPLNDPELAQAVEQHILAVVSGNLSKYNCQPDADYLLCGAAGIAEAAGADDDAVGTGAGADDGAGAGAGAGAGKGVRSGKDLGENSDKGAGKDSGKRSGKESGKGAGEDSAVELDPKSDFDPASNDSGADSDDFGSDSGKGASSGFESTRAAAAAAATAGAGDKLQVLREYFASAEKILLLDQCLGDASLTLGQAPDNAVELMLRQAQEHFPQAKIFLKVHPDVLSGKRESLLYKALQNRLDIRMLDCDVSVMSLLRARPVVFTVSSQSGFEALLCGCRVHCFGMPFYAGYGLTVDLQPCPRRNALSGVTLQMLFYAAYIKLCRYINPIRGSRCSVGEVIELLALQKSVNDQNRGGAVVYGVKSWKHPILKAYLKCTDGSRVCFTKSKERALALAARQGSTLVQWASKKDHDLEAAARRMGLRTLNVEDGFLRSIGLGCEHTWPFSLVFDPDGIYYDPKQPSGLEQILNHFADLPPQNRSALALRGSALRREILKANLTKYNVGTDNQPELLSLKAQLTAARSQGREIILVPGQVENDASVLEAGGSITFNAALLKAVRRDFPDSFVIYKPHPDVLALNRPGLRHGSALPCDFVIRETAITVLFGLIDRLCTLTSLSGFEALLRDLKVNVYGRPFYAGWGLTADCGEFPERRARLSVDELCAGVYILYPRYFDWCSGNFMTPEDCVWRLKHPGEMPGVQLIVRAARGFYALRRAAYRQFNKESANVKK